MYYTMLHFAMRILLCVRLSALTSGCASITRIINRAAGDGNVELRVDLPIARCVASRREPTLGRWRGCARSDWLPDCPPALCCSLLPGHIRPSYALAIRPVRAVDLS